eukprot:4556773-Amphidinium_carterae.1
MTSVIHPTSSYAYMSDGMVSLDQNPLFVIVDIGCTRAMCSRHAFDQLSREVQSIKGHTRGN